LQQNADLVEEDKKDSGKLSAGRGRSWSHPHPHRDHCVSDIAKKMLGTRTLDNAEKFTTSGLVVTDAMLQVIHAAYYFDVVGVRANQTSVGRLLVVSKGAEPVRIRGGVAPGDVRRQHVQKSAAPLALW